MDGTNYDIIKIKKNKNFVQKEHTTHIITAPHYHQATIAGGEFILV